MYVHVGGLSYNQVGLTKGITLLSLINSKEIMHDKLHVAEHRKTPNLSRGLNKG